MIVPVIITAVSVFMFYGYFGLIGTFQVSFWPTRCWQRRSSSSR